MQARDRKGEFVCVLVRMLVVSMLKPCSLPKKEIHTCEGQGVDTSCLCVSACICVLCVSFFFVRVFLFPFLDTPEEQGEETSCPHFLHICPSSETFNGIFLSLSHTHTHTHPIDFLSLTHAHTFSLFHTHTNTHPTAELASNSNTPAHFYRSLSLLHTHTQTHAYIRPPNYMVAKTHRIPYLYRSFSAKEPYI